MYIKDKGQSWGQFKFLQLINIIAANDQRSKQTV